MPTHSPWYQSRCGDNKVHVNVFFKQKKRMAVVALMLPERFAVIAEYDPERGLVQSARADAAHQRAERCIAVAQRAPIAIEIGLIRTRILRRVFLRRVVRVVTRNRQVGDEEAPVARRVIDPGQDAPHGQPFVVEAEARLVVAADVAGVCQRLKAPVPDDGLHAQVGEPAGSVIEDFEFDLNLALGFVLEGNNVRSYRLQDTGTLAFDGATDTQGQTPKQIAFV